jgi:nucleoside-triphosphatase
MADHRLAGFYTEEMRYHGNRVGFRAIALSGRTVVLAHVDISGPYRVGRYGVKIDTFESLVEEELGGVAGGSDLCIIDEIGKMECFSNVFIDAVTKLLDSDMPVLATIAAKGGGFVAEAKARPDVEVLHVSARNRDQLPRDLVGKLSSS